MVTTQGLAKVKWHLKKSLLCLVQVIQQEVKEVGEEEVGGEGETEERKEVAHPCHNLKPQESLLTPPGLFLG